MLMGLIYLRKLKGPEYGKSTLGERECDPVVKRMKKRVGPDSGGNEKESGASSVGNETDSGASS